MKIRINKSIEFWLLVLFVPIEAINGLLLNYIGMSFSPVGYLYRIVLILFYVKYLLKSKYLKYLLAFILMITGVVINMVIHPYSSFGTDFGQLFRILYVIVLCIGIHEKIDTGRVSANTILGTIDTSAVFMIVIYLLSILTNSGITTYAEGGYKAWFNASNSLTLVLVILSGVELTLYFQNKKKYNLIKFLIMDMFIFLAGSKSGIVFLIMFMIYMFWPKFNVIFLKRLLAIALIAVTLYFVLSRIFNTQMMAILNRMTYFIGNSDSKVQYLLSGRNDLLFYGWKAFVECFNPSSIIFGNGTYNMHILIGRMSGWGIEKNIEMDFFDIFFEFGVLGLFSTYWLTLKLVGIRKMNKMSPVYMLFLICILFSILGGHVFTDSFGTTILSMIAALSFYETKTGIYIE